MRQKKKFIQTLEKNFFDIYSKKNFKNRKETFKIFYFLMQLPFKMALITLTLVC